MKLELDCIPEPEFQVNGKNYLYFGGTSYLGIQQHPEFKSTLAAQIQYIGAHWGASRAGNVIVNPYERAEHKLAQWTGSERALTLSSGFLAGRLVVEYYLSAGYTPIYSPSCHAALLPIHATRLGSWQELQPILKANTQTHFILFTDTIDFNAPPEPILNQLGKLECKSLALVVDDSHGIGVLGEHGNSAYKQVSELGFQEMLLCGSLGKALGTSAGVVLGPDAVIQNLMKSPLFTGASPASPAQIATLEWALETKLFASQHLILRKRMEYLSAHLRAYPQLFQIQNFPVWTFKDPALAEYLANRNVLITHFNYTASGEADTASRIVLTASHSEAQLDVLIQHLQGYYQQL